MSERPWPWRHVGEQSAPGLAALERREPSGSDTHGATLPERGVGVPVTAEARCRRVVERGPGALHAVDVAACPAQSGAT